MTAAVDERPDLKAAPETSSFLSALLAVQAEAPTLPKDKTNPHFGSKFTGLDTIVEKVGPLLVKHRLVWITQPGRDELGPFLEYRLVHVDSGEGLIGRMPLLLSKGDSQGLGSALTYARRYALTAVLNLVADEDDDGNSTAQSSYGQNKPAPAKTTGRNLQSHAKGLGNPSLVAAFRQAGLEAPEHPWPALSNVPAQHYDALYAALTAARAAAGR
jgi:hypothetical protein